MNASDWTFIAVYPALALALGVAAVHTFGRNGVDWRNMLVFGENGTTPRPLTHG